MTLTRGYRASTYTLKGKQQCYIEDDITANTSSTKDIKNKYTV